MLVLKAIADRGGVVESQEGLKPAFFAPQVAYATIPAALNLKKG